MPQLNWSRLLSRQDVAEGTTAFHLEKPPHWDFRAGQYLDLTLINPPETDAEGNIRSFSIASSPREATLMVTTRMRNTAFKRTLKKMPIGSEVQVEGPSGDLILHSDSNRAAVFLAGGIGITPFRSIVVGAAEDNLPHRIFLFYSSHRPEDAPFLDELQALESRNPNYRLIATMTAMAKSQRHWNGETGKIDAGMLSRYLKDAPSPIYYVAGPPEMVKGLQTTLKSSGIADDDVRAEEFSGY